MAKFQKTSNPTIAGASAIPTPEILDDDDQDAEAFLSAVALRQDLAIEQLEKRLDELGNEFAARVRTMVERGLMVARSKALNEIRTIDVGFFLQTEPGTLPGSQSILTESQEVNQ